MSSIGLRDNFEFMRLLPVKLPFLNIFIVKIPQKLITNWPKIHRTQFSRCNKSLKMIFMIFDKFTVTRIFRIRNLDAIQKVEVTANFLKIIKIILEKLCTANFEVLLHSPIDCILRKLWNKNCSFRLVLLDKLCFF